MATFEIVALDEATPQLRAPGSADTYLAPRALAITPVSLTGSAATSSLSIAQTWNTTGTPTAIDLNVTDTASNAASLLMNLRVGASSLFRINKQGTLQIGLGANLFQVFGPSGAVDISSAATYSFNNDTLLARDAANTLALRNGTNAQAFNVYNTFTDASNYERAQIAWASNVAYLRNQNLGTGSARPLVYVSGTVTVANLPAAATAGAGARLTVTDANATTFQAVVAGGGANVVPVYSDGTNWRIG